MKGDELLAWGPKEFSGDRALGWVDSTASFFHVSMLPADINTIFARSDSESQFDMQKLLSGEISDSLLSELLRHSLGKEPQENILRLSIFVHEFKHFFDILSTPTGLAHLWHILYDNSLFIEAWRNDGRNHVGKAIFKTFGLPAASTKDIKRFKESLTKSPSVEVWWKAWHTHSHRLRVIRDGDVSVPDAYKEKLKGNIQLPPYIDAFMHTEAMQTAFIIVPIRYVEMELRTSNVEEMITLTPLGFRQIMEGSALASQLLLFSIPGFDKFHQEFRGIFFNNTELSVYTACDLLTSKYITSFSYDDFSSLCDAALIVQPGLYTDMLPGDAFVKILYCLRGKKLNTTNLHSIVDEINKDDASIVSHLNSTLEWIADWNTAPFYPWNEFVPALSHIASRFVKFRLKNNNGLPSLLDIAKGLRSKELPLPPVFSIMDKVGIPIDSKDYAYSFMRFYAARSIQDDLTYVGKIMCPLRKLNLKCEMMTKKCGQWPDNGTVNWPDCFFRRVAEQVFALDKIERSRFHFFRTI